MKIEGSWKISFLLSVMSVCLYLSGESRAYIQILLCHIRSAFHIAASPLNILPLVEQKPSLHSISSNPKTMFP